MLCATCWHDLQDVSDSSPCTACGGAASLVGRYRLDKRLGQGAAGIAFAATRLIDQRRVCIKGLSYRSMTSLDAERFFRREAQVLREIHDPQVPAYIDDFAAGAGPSFTLYLVQELVDGVDLEDERRARRPTVPEVVATIDEVLAIVARLHALTPPVVHRDIKPRNVMRRAADGRLVLVDFGAVKEAVQSSIDPGLSVQGTFGFMAPEQMRGEASPGSDLFAIGMVTIALLTGVEPTQLMDDDKVVRWERAVSIAPALAAWVRRMTAPDPAGRFADATMARAALAAAMKAAAEVEVSAPQPRPVARPSFGTSEDGAAFADSPATAPSGNAGRVVVTLFGILVVIGGTFALAMRASHHTETTFGQGKTEVALTPRCKDACRALTSPFKENLRFGMTLDEARAARPDVANAAPLREPGEAGFDPTTPRAAAYERMPALPGDIAATRVCMSSEVVGSEGHCCLDFGAMGLGRIACVSDGLFDDAAQLANVRKIADVYGKPNEPIMRDAIPYLVEPLPEIRWSTRDAALEASFPTGFDAESTDPSNAGSMTLRSRIVMTQTSSAWDYAVDDARGAKDDAARKAQAEADAARQRALEREREERKKLGLPADPL